MSTLNKNPPRVHNKLKTVKEQSKVNQSKQLEEDETKGWIGYDQTDSIKPSSWPKLNSDQNEKYSTLSTKKESSTFKNESEPAESKWQRFWQSFKISRLIQGSDQIVNHSHNCSNSILQAGVWNMQCSKTSNQDRCTALSYTEKDFELSFFGIYGGHGGIGVANYLRDCLHDFILDQPDYKMGNIQGAISKAFLQVDGELRSFGFATELTGSIATLILVKRGELFCANLGNYRAIASVGGHTKVLSLDHSTFNPKERDRVKEMGGTIKGNRVAGLLFPTRSFGHFLLKSDIDKPPWKQDLVTYIRTQLCGFSASRDKLNVSKLCESVIEKCCGQKVSGKSKLENFSLIIIWFDYGSSSDTLSSIYSSCNSR